MIFNFCNQFILVPLLYLFGFQLSFIKDSNMKLNYDLRNTSISRIPVGLRIHEQNTCMRNYFHLKSHELLLNLKAYKMKPLTLCAQEIEFISEILHFLGKHTQCNSRESKRRDASRCRTCFRFAKRWAPAAILHTGSAMV